MDNFYKYLNACEKDKAWGLHILSCGLYKYFSGQHYPVRAHPPDYFFSWEKGRVLDSYFVVFIASGKGVFESASCGLSRVRAGDAFLLFPGEWHRYKPDKETGWEEYWIGYKGILSDEWMQKGLISKESPVIKGGHHALLHSLFNEVIDLTRHTPPGYMQTIASITMRIISLLYLRTEAPDHDNYPDMQELIERACFLIEQRIDKKVHLPELARELCMSYALFRKTFKQIRGVSPQRYLMSLRIRKAKELLSTTTLTVGEVAACCGFDSAYYFSRLFKEKTRQGPSRYRQLAAARTNDRQYAGE